MQTIIDEPDLRAHVETLARTPRVPGTEHHAVAGAYIEARLEMFGYEPLLVQGASGEGVNVHARRGDRNRPLFVVGAHYDTVAGSPGADDNASGVAVLLEVARAFAAVDPTVCIEFVAYDLEESGLRGSREHCGHLRRREADVAGMLSLEMLGFTGEGQVFVPGVQTSRSKGDFLAVVANDKSAHLLKMFEGLGTSLPMECVVAPDGTEAGALSQLSDHGSFWAAGFPALLVTDTAFLRNPHYHRPTDLPATLDYAFLKQSADAVLEAIARFTTAVR
jgi:Zn-dependent M28 family amino/carboxypeptidase